MEKQNPGKFVLDYKEEETVRQFQDAVKSWKKTKAYYKKDVGLKELRGLNLFFVFSRRQFMLLYLGFTEFLKRELERELESRTDVYGMIPYYVPENVEADCAFYRYREWRGKREFPSFEIGYYDRRYDTFFNRDEETASLYEKPEDYDYIV